MEVYSTLGLMLEELEGLEGAERGDVGWGMGGIWPACISPEAGEAMGVEIGGIEGT